MRKRGITAAIAACTLALAVSACGGSSSDDSGTTGALKIGLLNSFSGAASASFTGTLQGVKARIAAYQEDKGKCSSRTIQVLQGDDQSSAQGALSATQKLIQQDKVYAILETSSFFYGVAPFLTTTGKKTPVVGGAFDGATQWNDTKNNLFPASPVPQFDKTYTTLGQYLKQQGGTKLAGIAYKSPSAQAGLEAGLKSAEAAGLKRAYVNTSVPFGSTDVGAIVLGIIKSGADVVNMTMTPDTGFAVVAGLRQANYKTKAIVLATGYGADLLQSAPAVQVGQGVTFSVGFSPAELKTPGNVRMTKALIAHGGSKSGIPSFSQAQGWLTADLFLHGLEVAGCNASQAKFISTLRTDKTWTADGLYPTPFDFTTTVAPKQCLYFLRLKGSAFVPEPNATPICGTTVN